ncbi:MAG: beta-ketoacyl synthase N-terminal-like domain-containing protein [Verrucomicrobiota bacterium]
MKVTFVYPRFEKFLSSLPELDQGLINYFLGDFTTPPSLGIPLLAAMTPPEIDVELVDDNSGQPIPYDAPTDLVAINCFTPQAARAFEIADAYRAHGKKVVMGGLFPTFMASECLKHADAVNVGEGEPTWHQILKDAQAGTLKPRYMGGASTNMAQVPAARREIFYQNNFYDWDEDLVQVMRGCSYTCAMCALPAQMGGRIRFRPIERVVEEISRCKHENVYLADDMLFFQHRRINEYARELFTALEPLQKKYFVSSTMALNTDNAFLDLAARAGVRNFYCTLNVDPFSIKALQGEARERQMLIDLVKSIEDRGIRFFASCALGRDWDDERIADQILTLFDAAKIRTAEFFIFTPYPGSVHWDRMLRQERIFDFNWRHYNGAHVVSKPQNLTPDQLRKQFVKVWREFFKMQKAQHAAHLEPATWQDGVQVLGKPMQRQGARTQAVVTGVGILSPIGNDPETVTEALRTGRHGLTAVSKYDSRHFRTNLGGEIKNFNPADWLSPAEFQEYDDPYLHYAIAAARLALRDAGLDWKELRRDVGLVLGTCNGGLCSAEAEYAWKHGRSSRAFDERMNLHAQFFGFGKAMANALKIGGETYVVTTACSSTTVALGLAQMLIQRGYYDTVLVGGADILCVANVSGFDALKATSSGRIAPFSQPCGLNIGEGACFWVVETLEKALLRHARCRGRIAGHATSADAYHPTTPDPRGLGVCRTLTNALSDSGYSLAEIGCINGHGSGTEANDKAESRGVAKFIDGQPIPLVSTKSYFGHCMGVTGILEATSQLLAMNHDFIPPTLNFSEPRPGCALDYVPNEARPKKYEAFISANYAFGGNNAAVVVTKWDAPLNPPVRAAERVVITGLGTVTAAGLGIQKTLEQLRNNAVCLSPARGFPLNGARAKLIGHVPEFKAAEVDRRIDFASLNLISRFAVAAGRLALDHAGLKITPQNGDDAGVVMGVCNGPSEMGHMDRVFTSENFAADVTSFSNITSNSTAGWVSNTLYLKGVNASLASGPHAGLQSLAYAYDSLVENRAKVILAGAADEAYAQTFYNYDGMDFLYAGEEESDYRLRTTVERRKVLGEGAAMICLETATHATCRNANILAEMLGYGMSMDGDGFTAANLRPEGLIHAVQLALSRASVAAREIGLLVWAPQGNRQDLKVLEAGRSVFGERFAQMPLAATTFNTGYIESASILVSLAAALQSLHAAESTLWPQRTGLPELDARALPQPPDYILAMASTDLGYNYAAVFRRRWKAAAAAE